MYRGDRRRQAVRRSGDTVRCSKNSATPDGPCQKNLRYRFFSQSETWFR